MGDGGEGEDEVQFLRTVRISAACLVVLFALCLLGGSLRFGVSFAGFLGDCHSDSMFAFFFFCF